MSAKPASFRAEGPNITRPARFAVIFAACFLAGIGLVMLPPVQRIDNLPYAANETDVQNFFATHGVHVIAQQAVDNCHGKELMGRAVVVNEARPMAPREGGGRGPRS